MFKVIFQSKSVDEIECTSEKVLLHPSDYKKLGLKPGSLVNVNGLIICRVWPSKLQNKGIAILNKIWTELFPSNIKDRVISITASLPSNTVHVHDVQFLIQVQDFKSNLQNSKEFTEYIKGLLIGVEFVTDRLQLHVLWKGKPLCVFIDCVYSNSAVNSIELLKRIDNSSILQYQPETVKSSKHVCIDDIINSIQLKFGGYSSVIREAVIITALALNLHPQINSDTVKPRGMLLYGSSGTGKSILMNLIVKQFNCHAINIKSDVLIQKYVGEAENLLVSYFDEASLHSPSFILIDDIELIFQDRSKGSEEQNRLVSLFLSLLDGVNSAIQYDRVFVIATSSRPQLIDSALRRPGRFDKEIELTVPTQHDRSQILRVLLSDMGISRINTNKSLSLDMRSLSQDEFMNEIISKIASQAHGMVGSDLELVIKEAYLLQLFNSKNYKKFETKYLQTTSDGDVDKLAIGLNDVTIHSSEESSCQNTSESLFSNDETYNSISEEYLYEAISKVSPSALKEIAVESPNVKWSDIGGMEQVKQSLKEVVEWPLLYPQLFESMGISPPSGVLLYGPPGCSKTLMAKALATESSMNFLAVRGPELLSKYLGESEKAIQALFRRARMSAPSIIFFDEIDALTGKRGSSNAGVSDRVLSQLLTEIDGIQSAKKVIVIAATNRPDLIDPALLRPGRIDRKIYVGQPDKLSRRSILELNLSKMPLDESVSIDELVDLSDGFSGAEVVAICSEAAYLAMDSNDIYIRQKYLIEVIHSMKPQISPEMIKFYDDIKSKFVI